MHNNIESIPMLAFCVDIAANILYAKHASFSSDFFILNNFIDNSITAGNAQISLKQSSEELGPYISLSSCYE